MGGSESSQPTEQPSPSQGNGEEEEEESEIETLRERIRQMNRVQNRLRRRSLKQIALELSRLNRTIRKLKATKEVQSSETPPHGQHGSQTEAQREELMEDLLLEPLVLMEDPHPDWSRFIHIIRKLKEIEEEVQSSETPPHGQHGSQTEAQREELMDKLLLSLFRLNRTIRKLKEIEEEVQSSESPPHGQHGSQTEVQRKELMEELRRLMLHHTFLDHRMVMFEDPPPHPEKLMESLLHCRSDLIEHLLRWLWCVDSEEEGESNESPPHGQHGSQTEAQSSEPQRPNCSEVSESAAVRRTSSDESDSGLSFKSDQSKEQIIYFKRLSSPLKEKERERERLRENRRQLEEEIAEIKRDTDRDKERWKMLENLVHPQLGKPLEGLLLLELEEKKRVIETLRKRQIQLKEEMVAQNKKDTDRLREEKEREIERLRERIRQLEMAEKERNRQRPRTSSDGSDASSVSLKRDQSKGEGINFKRQPSSPLGMPLEDVPVAYETNGYKSGVSLKSDQSEEDSGRSSPVTSSDKSDDSGVSLKSDQSKEKIMNFNGPSAPLKVAGPCTAHPSAVHTATGPPIAPDRTGDTGVIRSLAQSILTPPQQKKKKKKRIKVKRENKTARGGDDRERETKRQEEKD